MNDNNSMSSVIDSNEGLYNIGVRILWAPSSQTQSHAVPFVYGAWSATASAYQISSVR